MLWSASLKSLKTLPTPTLAANEHVACNHFFYIYKFNSNMLCMCSLFPRATFRDFYFTTAGASAVWWIQNVSPLLHRRTAFIFIYIGITKLIQGPVVQN